MLFYMSLRLKGHLDLKMSRRRPHIKSAMLLVKSVPKRKFTLPCNTCATRSMSPSTPSTQ